MSVGSSATDPAGRVVYVPNEDFVGTDSFTFNVSNEGGEAPQSALVLITVDPSNDAPEFDEGLEENNPYTAVVGSPFSLAITATDKDVGDFVTVTVIDKPTWLALNPTGNGTASLVGTPSEGNVGSHTMTLTASDGNVDGSVELEITIDVSAVSGATITMEDWRKKYFGKDLDGDISFSADLANPDMDGLTNLLEYYMGLDPLTADDGDALSLRLNEAGTHLICGYPRSKSVIDATGAVEWSADGAPGSSEGVTENVIGDLGGAWLMEARVPTDGAPSRIVRITVRR
jgi:hypothetical protein